ncbi:MAG: hypothetical protein ACTSPY_18035 [Candidatus Helarchaeota archaeon]
MSYLDKRENIVSEIDWRIEFAKIISIVVIVIYHMLIFTGWLKEDL